MRRVDLRALWAFFINGFVFGEAQTKENENLLSKYQTVLDTFVRQKYHKFCLTLAKKHQEVSLSVLDTKIKRGILGKYKETDIIWC